MHCYALPVKIINRFNYAGTLKIKRLVNKNARLLLAGRFVFL